MCLYYDKQISYEVSRTELVQSPVTALERRVLHRTNEDKS